MIAAVVGDRRFTAEVTGRPCAQCDDDGVPSHAAERFALLVAAELGEERSGDNLRYMRDALGLRSADLAELLDVSIETMSPFDLDVLLVAITVAIENGLASDLDVRVPRLTVVGGGVLTLDGRMIDSGVPNLVDPGKHVVLAKHDGAEDRREVDLAERANVTVRIDGSADDQRGSSIPTSTVFLFAAGGATLLVGGAFAWSARSANLESRSHCGLGGQPNACDDEGLRLRSTAGARADVATVSILLGGVAVSGALAVWAWSPRGESKNQTVSLGFGAGFAQLTGIF